MEAYLLISYLNDFIFCPRSIYFHQLYGNVHQYLYQTTDQVKGQGAHKTIDSGCYTTAKSVLQGLSVYSEQYRIGGKIDTYDQTKSLLVERKKRVKVIYDGYIYQLYAQYHCLTEMGYTVKQLKIYSMDDNKNYPIKLPNQDPARQAGFENLLQQIQDYQLTESFVQNPAKCQRCIYNNLCDVVKC